MLHFCQKLTVNSQKAAIVDTTLQPKHCSVSNNTKMGKNILQEPVWVPGQNIGLTGICNIPPNQNIGLMGW